MASTRREQIEKIDEKLAVLQARKRQLEAQERDNERKARTKRLIEIGGAVESVLGKPIYQEDLPKLIGFLKEQENRGNFFSKAMQNERTE